MYFCANPKCKFHVDVPRGVYLHTIILPEPVRPLSEKLSEYAMTETRMKHLWRNSEEETEWFFCDICHEAALMVAPK